MSFGLTLAVLNLVCLSLYLAAPIDRGQPWALLAHLCAVLSVLCLCLGI